ncbi:MAG: DMT family transporter [Desulfarculaceae bacterium]|nr:DMT family transporter [Desulfarculaceae bacterium]MCF8047645.1 DMT family transporter [Desulfarculaceae bacterium]MCF8063716.1 DMT family transporter [Desulfarculaceae bacterium]MCF8097045.1 DMT family transporter [Desulfarculaceae bacterium]MCF8121586.1 DMT family transporter [Desulfarculaceae bacterium]
MSWFWLALSSAFFLATADYLTKRHFSDLPVGQMVLVRLTGLAPVCLAVLLLNPMPRIEPAFFWAAGLALPAEVAALFLYLRAIQLSPLSLTMPFMAFTPLFVIGTGWLFLDELPTTAGLVGVVLVVAGAYALNLHQVRRGWSAPLLAVTKEKGSLLALAVSALYGYTLTLGKVALAASGPWFMASLYPLGLALIIVGALAARRQVGWDWLRRPWPALGVGLCMAAMLVSHFWSLSLAPAAYMVAVKRLSIIMAVLYGGVFLKEARLAQHLMASGLMVAGAVVILLAG